MNIKLQLEGLDCAGCAAELEGLVAAVDGVLSATVAFASQTLFLEYENEAALAKVKEVVNGFEEVRVVEKAQGAMSGKRQDGKILLKLRNLHCAACAMDLEDELKKIKGVRFVQVDFVTQSILLDAEDSAVRTVISKANKFEKVEVLNGDEVAPQTQSYKREIISIALSACFFLLGFLLKIFLKNPRLPMRILTYVSYAIAYFSVGYPVLVSTAKNVVKGRIFDENFLMTVASCGAVCLGEYGEGVAVMLLYQIGELLQSIAVGSSRRNIAALVELKSEWATRLLDGKQEQVRPEELIVGDVCQVKTGEKVPTDGVLLSESASIDTKSLTGEPLPRELKKGDELLSGTINAGGMVEMKVTRLYENSAVSQILELVENSTAKRAAPEKFITKFARYYTPAVCFLAVAIAFLMPLTAYISGGSYAAQFPKYLSIALNLLVISCPCALIISVPLTYFSGVGSCAKNGILVKGATYLDEVAKVKTVAFDKTGTLTYGNFEVVEIYPEEGTDKEELIRLAAALEVTSSHPIAKAFVSCFQETDENRLPIVTNAKELAGYGITGEIDGKTALCGNAALLQNNGVFVQERKSLNTLVYFALDGKFYGCIGVGDVLRKEAKEALAALKKAGVERTVMLTGDRKERAEKIANELGMDEVKTELLPEDKSGEAEKLKSFGKLMYVGDGINDAPVMTIADCAVSMGKLGSAAAVEASDLVLISDRLTALGKCLTIAKKTRTIVMQNIIFAVVAKAAFMVCGFFGLPLWAAVFADVGVMLLAVLNSLRMRQRIKGGN